MYLLYGYTANLHFCSVSESITFVMPFNSALKQLQEETFITPPAVGEAES